ncbi:S-methyl-5-thioribose-1-phosphate isomerase [Clostridium sp. Marseille-Q2269]|uniref:S-methyl-5-thioribose-1-phosphate isomerase n=1 Tax=Clostridium sp. Marseille-Q2269 TaxID=2942205 RepID=UPI00207323E4|nr:S-methyl-5-thioribose-1-phosphate isomerase [Clostridium sp. Marseille-Q2269]
MSELLAIKWDDKRDKLILLDQTILPNNIEYIEYDTVEDIYHSIKDMIVRGAPAIGVTAAYGLYFAAKVAPEYNFEEFFKYLKNKASYLDSSRPTAVNLSWALKVMINKALENKHKSIKDIKSILREEAKRIHEEDIKICRAIGENLIILLKDGYGILTHCNAGQLATSKYGTATSPMYIAKEKGWNLKVYSDETRPRLQGSALTALELYEAGIDVTTITDNMAAMVMSQGKIDAVIVGCDRIAANGDTANKIGTMGVSILAKYFGIPMYIAAPTPSIDMNTKSGEDIQIEERNSEEVTCRFGIWTAPHGVKVYNPGFDVTPNQNITAIITEEGIVYQPFGKNLKKLFEDKIYKRY